MLPSRMSRLVVYEVLLISTTRNMLPASQVEGRGFPWQRPFIRVPESSMSSMPCCHPSTNPPVDHSQPKQKRLKPAQLAASTRKPTSKPQDRNQEARRSTLRRRHVTPEERAAPSEISHPIGEFEKEGSLTGIIPGCGERSELLVTRVT